MSKELTQAEKDALRREYGLPTGSEVIAKLDSILDYYASLRMSELIDQVIEDWGDTYVLTYGGPTVVFEITTGDLVASWMQTERRRHFNPVFDAKWCYAPRHT